ncbi:MAG TPA: NAD(P)H-dependent glycerol-3-phosphate dehydrogenase [Polyangiaceae bacterium]|nr:NAD(P)H-dependent glycerol-3-phosphate dehydrogenase [Polyangiaceae bacterium]
MSAQIPVAVLGAGNWGTTLAHRIASNGHAVTLWTRDAVARDEIHAKRTNSRSVPGLVIAPNVRAVTQMQEAVVGAALVLFVVPSQAFRAVCRDAAEFLSPEQLVIHATKGLEQGTHRRMSELLLEETCARQIGVLAGPNIAAEIAAGLPAGTVVASHFPRVVRVGQQVLSSARMMVFSGDDVVGVELAGAFKNVVAIAAGMAAELGVGENAKAFLVTRGLAEMARLGTALGARPLTFAGLTGVGDLTVTCASTQSRNNRVGRALARGKALPDVLRELGMVAEGVYASVSAHELAAAHRIDLPLMDQVYRVLYERQSPTASVDELMRLPAGDDVGASRRPAAPER